MMDSDTLLIFDDPGGRYDDGMIALGPTVIGPRVFPMPWQARAIGLAVNGSVVMMTREEALDAARLLRSMAHDG